MSNLEEQEVAFSKTVFGFWIYLLTDFMLFGVLFAVYAVLKKNTFGGPSAEDLFALPPVLLQTVILLIGAFTIGLGSVMAHKGDVKRTILLYSATFLLGLVFMCLQFAEWHHLIASGNGWEKSAFLSAYFTLSGTFALHMVFALLWVIVLLIPVIKSGLTMVNLQRLVCLKMFWQFLNVIWVFIYTIVYLMGAF